MPVQMEEHVIPTLSEGVEVDNGHRCDICDEGHSSTSSLGKMQNYNLIKCYGLQC